MTSSNEIETRVSIEFSIVGKTFELSEVTRLLGIKPTDCTFEKKIRTENTESGYDIQTSWTYETGHSLSGSVPQSMQPLLKLFLPKKNIIQAINDRFSTTTLVMVVVHVGSDGFPALYLEKSVLDFLHDINAEFGTDVYLESGIVKQENELSDYTNEEFTSSEDSRPIQDRDNIRPIKPLVPEKVNPHITKKKKGLER